MWLLKGIQCKFGEYLFRTFRRHLRNWNYCTSCGWGWRVRMWLPPSTRLSLGPGWWREASACILTNVHDYCWLEMQGGKILENKGGVTTNRWSPKYLGMTSYFGGSPQKYSLVLLNLAPQYINICKAESIIRFVNCNFFDRCNSRIIVFQEIRFEKSRFNLPSYPCEEPFLYLKFKKN